MRLMFILVLIAVVFAINPAQSQAQLSEQPLIIEQDGMLLRWLPSTNQLQPLTSGGINEHPVVSPDGRRVAFISVAQIALDSNPQPGVFLGDLPGNIHVLDLASNIISEIAGQPPNAQFNGVIAENVMARSVPSWSPDSNRLAWTEVSYPDYGFRLMMYDFPTNSTRIVTENFPSGFQDAGVYVPPVKSGGGIANLEITFLPGAQPMGFGNRLHLYDDNGGLRSIEIGLDEVADARAYVWVTVNDAPYVAIIYRSGLIDLIDPATGIVEPVNGLLERYTPLAPQTSSSLLMGASTTPVIDFDYNMSWWSISADGTQATQVDIDADLPFTIDRISPMPTAGQFLIVDEPRFSAGALRLWNNGQLTTMPVGAVQAFAQYPAAWRIRPFDQVPANVPRPIFTPHTNCTTAPDLSINVTAQVDPSATAPNNLYLLGDPPRISIGSIPPSGSFTVIDGPVCVGRQLWWQVNFNQSIGWTTQGSADTQRLFPVGSSQAPPLAESCPGLIQSRLIVNGQAQVIPNTSPNNLRGEPDTASANVGQIPPGQPFIVINGPQCNEGFAWWQVDFNGLVGWTAEGSGNSYWLEPLS